MNLWIFRVLRGRRGKLFDIFVPPSLQRGCSDVTINNLIFAQQPEKSFETSSADLLYLMFNKAAFQVTVPSINSAFLAVKKRNKIFGRNGKIDIPTWLGKSGYGNQSCQRPKNLSDGVALPTGKFLRVQKFFYVWPPKFPDGLKSFQMVWTVAGWFGKCLESLKSFQAV